MYTEAEDQNPYKCSISVFQVCSVFHVWLYICVCKYSSRIKKNHNLEVMKIANLHFCLHQNNANSDKTNLPNTENNEQHEFKIFSGKDSLSIDTMKTVNQIMLEHLYSNELARNILPWERANCLLSSILQ